MENEELDLVDTFPRDERVVIRRLRYLLDQYYQLALDQVSDESDLEECRQIIADTMYTIYKLGMKFQINALVQIVDPPPYTDIQDLMNWQFTRFEHCLSNDQLSAYKSVWKRVHAYQQKKEQKKKRKKRKGDN